MMLAIRERLKPLAKFLRKNWFYLTALIAAAAHAFRFIVVDWPVVVLLMLAGFPIWFPTLVRSVRAIRRTDKGWDVEFNSNNEGLTAEVIEKIAHGGTKGPPAPFPSPRFDDLSEAARYILKTLWHFQRRIFGLTDDRRWGFGVSAESPDQFAFRNGADELVRLGLTAMDLHDLIYFTNEGIDYCRKNQDELDKVPLYYRNFRPAPNR